MLKAITSGYLKAVVGANGQCVMGQMGEYRGNELLMTQSVSKYATHNMSCARQREHSESFSEKFVTERRHAAENFTG